MQKVPAVMLWEAYESYAWENPVDWGERSAVKQTELMPREAFPDELLIILQLTEPKAGKQFQDVCEMIYENIP